MHGDSEGISKGGSCWSGNRGRRPSTTTCSEVQEKVMELATGAYSGFPRPRCWQIGSIHLSRSTVRRVLLPGESEAPVVAGAQALPSKGALPPGGNAVADRWEPAQLAGGSRTTSDSHRPVEATLGPIRSFRQQEDYMQGDHRSPRNPNGPVQRPA